MCAPGITAIEADLHISSTIASTLAVTLYVLGIAIGPMFMSPLSELYGRAPVYHAANMMFVAFIVGSALSQNLAQFLVFRFFSGCAGGTPMALGGGTIADITTVQKRAVAMALFSMGPLAGPVSRSLSLSLSRSYPVQASAWLIYSFRFSAQSSEALLPQDRVGVGRFGC
jgi:MFS family permease